MHTYFFTSMLKPCQGIELQPIKFTPTKDVAQSKQIYIPPCKRAEKKPEDAVLTASDMDSATLFPTLNPMHPTTKGASWNQIRARLTKPLVNVIEDAIERERKETEEGILQEMETDPTKMTEKQRKANGWESISIPSEMPDFSVMHAEYPWNPETDWLHVPDFSPDIMNDSSKFLKYAECMHADGSPIERTVHRSTMNPLVRAQQPQERLAFQRFWGATYKL